MFGRWAGKTSRKTILHLEVEVGGPNAQQTFCVRVTQIEK